MIARSRAPLVALLPFLLVAGCGPSVDVREALELTDISSGWFDAGVVNGQNKIVPSVSFRVRHRDGAHSTRLDRVALNVLFRHPLVAGAEREEEWDEVFVQSAAFENGQTQMLVVRPDKGYTGDPPQSRMDLLQHSMFRDVHARVFAKHGSTQWVELGVIEVERQLLTR